MCVCVYRWSSYLRFGGVQQIIISPWGFSAKTRSIAEHLEELDDEGREEVLKNQPEEVMKR